MEPVGALPVRVPLREEAQAADTAESKLHVLEGGKSKGRAGGNITRTDRHTEPVK